ncbi:hypothetical protein BD779DRAFT_1803371 [Infundibulicybe gibba]|nr:hypothetical protein BD779DRAFT_1803371 [Infundibulicybe gibba]
MSWGLNPKCRYLPATKLRDSTFLHDTQSLCRTSWHPQSVNNVYSSSFPRSDVLQPPSLPRQKPRSLSPNLRAANSDRFPLSIFSRLPPELAHLVVPRSTNLILKGVECHLGTIETIAPQSFEEIWSFFQTLMRQPLPLPLFHCLSNEIKESVRDSFYDGWDFTQDRWRRDANEIWGDFLRGRPHLNGPKGLDLLARNYNFWGVELGGSVWLIHLAIPYRPEEY